MNSYLWPARHWAGSDPDPALPPMGLRVRLKAGKDISTFKPQSKVLAQAMKTYGLILADNGSPWYVTGVPDAGWDNDDLRDLLTKLTGADFEVVDTSSMAAGANTAGSPTPRAAPGHGRRRHDRLHRRDRRRQPGGEGQRRLRQRPALRDAAVPGLPVARRRGGRREGVVRCGGGRRVHARAGDRRVHLVARIRRLRGPVVRLYFATFLRVPDYAG